MRNNAPAVIKGADPARCVSAGRLDLDDVCSEIPQHLATKQTTSVCQSKNPTHLRRPVFRETGAG